MSSLSVPAAPDCTIVFDSEGGYCLEDTLSRRPDPLTLADALTCIATDECEVPERFADLLAAWRAKATDSFSEALVREHCARRRGSPQLDRTTGFLFPTFSYTYSFTLP